MDKIALICIICGCILLLLIVAIIFIRRSNKKRFNKLQENLKKYKAEKESLENDNKITLSKDEEEIDTGEVKQNPIANEESENKTLKPIIEDFDFKPQNTKKTNQNNTNSIQSDNDFNQLDFLNQIRINKNSNRQQKKDDFEEFLDEHAYSRRIINKDIMSKIKNLPPEIKALILSNVFNKYDE